MFSVLMNVYKNDNAEHFEQAIESVINQTLRPDEIVLVVDGPIGNEIIDVIAKYPFLKTIWLKENVGQGTARNIGLKSCTHELVAIMDSDDIAVSDRFEKQVLCFDDADLSIVGGNIEEFIDKIDNIVGIREVPQEDLKIKKYLRKRCPFNQVTIMFRRSHVERAGGYLDWHFNEDYYLWIRMLIAGCKFKNLSSCLAMVRVNESTYRRRGGFKYFESEIKLQSFMYKHKLISVFRFLHNVCLRFFLQIIFPNKIRGFIYKKFGRKRFVLQKEVNQSTLDKGFKY